MNHLRIKIDRIALESFSGADIKQLLTNAIPSALSDVKDFFGKFTNTAAAVVLGFNPASFFKEVSKHPYLDISPLTAYVPEGLDTTFLEYSHKLLPATEHATGIITNVLAAYTVFLSQLINNSDFKHSTNSFEKVYKDLALERVRFNADIGQCFKKGSTKTEVSIGDVVRRNNDWQQVFSEAEHLLKMINSVDHKVLNRKIGECSDLLDVILEKIKRNEFEGMSPEIIRNLSDGAFQVASELEFYSVMHYRVTAYANAVTRTAEHFEKTMKH